MTVKTTGIKTLVTASLSPEAITVAKAYMMSEAAAEPTASHVAELLDWHGSPTATARHILSSVCASDPYHPKLKEALRYFNSFTKPNFSRAVETLIIAGYRSLRLGAEASTAGNAGPIKAKSTERKPRTKAGHATIRQ